MKTTDLSAPYVRPQSNPTITLVATLLLASTALISPALAQDQDAATFTRIERLPSGDVLLEQSAASGRDYRLETSTDLIEWIALMTARSTGTIQYTDSGTSARPARFYRSISAQEPNTLTGDHLATDDGEIVFHPINHASFVMKWKDKFIYNDPVGGAGLYSGLPRADLILISHGHGDHFDSSTLNAVRGTNTAIIAPRAVYNNLSATLRNLATALTNGASADVIGLNVEAVSAYNNNHPRGDGNGYVLTIGGRRIYMSGDTGNTTEMRALQNIDVAFLCMNLPYTMSVSDAATAVRAFRPRIVYPYHFRNQGGSLSDLNAFKQQVGTDLQIEVRNRKWY